MTAKNNSNKVAEQTRTDHTQTMPSPSMVPAGPRDKTLMILEKLKDTLTKVLVSVNAPPDVVSRVNQVIHDTAAGLPHEDHEKASEAAKAKA